jgi:hypothetical protein
VQKREEEEEEDEDQGKVVAGWRKGLLVMPFIGIHTVQGIAASDYDSGLRLGALAGTHLEAPVSLNVEVAVDFLNRSVNGARSVAGRDLTIAFAPLFHASAGLAELVVGPLLGYWASSFTTDNGSISESQFSQTGWAFGVNVGGFGGVNDSLALGAMISYQMTHLSQSCERGAGASISPCSSNDLVPQILAFDVAALF